MPNASPITERIMAYLEERPDEWVPYEVLLTLAEELVPPGKALRRYETVAARYKIQELNDSEDARIAVGRRSFITECLQGATKRGRIERRKSGPKPADREFRWLRGPLPTGGHIQQEARRNLQAEVEKLQAQVEEYREELNTQAIKMMELRNQLIKAQDTITLYRRGVLTSGWITRS